MDGAYGIPHFINSVNEWRYGALVIDGASPILRNLDFSDINTSSVLTTSLAQPTFIDSSFSVGNDEESNVGGSAMQIYASGTSVAPFTLNNPFFKDGTENAKHVTRKGAVSEDVISIFNTISTWYFFSNT